MFELLVILEHSRLFFSMANLLQIFCFVLADLVRGLYFSYRNKTLIVQAAWFVSSLTLKSMSSKPCDLVHAQLLELLPICSNQPCPKLELFHIFFIKNVQCVCLLTSLICWASSATVFCLFQKIACFPLVQFVHHPSPEEKHKLHIFPYLKFNVYVL